MKFYVQCIDKNNIYINPLTGKGNTLLILKNQQNIQRVFFLNLLFLSLSLKRKNIIKNFWYEFQKLGVGNNILPPYKGLKLIFAVVKITCPAYF